MDEQNDSVEPNYNYIKNLSNSSELENNPPTAKSNNRQSVEGSNANLVSSSSACSKYGNNGTNQTVAEYPSCVWAYGRIFTRFPDECIRREYKNAIARIDTTGMDEDEIRYAVLSKPENRYLIRKICWVFNIALMDTYVLLPADIQDYDLLIDAINPKPPCPELPARIDIVVGTRGGTADLSMCNCLPLPIVIFDRIFSFDMCDMAKKITDVLVSYKKECGTFQTRDEELIKKGVVDVFTKVMSSMENAGNTDEHRAINFMLTDPFVFLSIKYNQDHKRLLDSISARPASVSGIRKVSDVIFTYLDTNTPTDRIYQEFIRVDVTCEFPFIVSEPRQLIVHLSEE